MKKVRTYLLLVASIALFFLGCSGDKNSNEACLHQTTMDLDKGNFDAVLASGCADSMQKGAAYFGKAGFDITNVVKQLMETENNDTGSSGGSTSDFSVYMTALVGDVDETTFSNLGLSKAEYSSITATSDHYKDAQFYIGIVDTVNGLSLIKSLVDVLGDGTLDNTCDMNNNSTPDSLDAAGCALLTSVGTQCTGSTSKVYDSNIANLSLSNPSSGSTYTGPFRSLTIATTGTGTNVSSCPTNNQYKYLLVSSGSSYAVVTTASGDAECEDANGTKWPCPILDENGDPIELVSAFDTVLTSAIDSITTSLSSGTTVTTTDVSQSIEDIKAEACPSGTCTATDLAAYLQTY